MAWVFVCEGVSVRRESRKIGKTLELPFILVIPLSDPAEQQRAGKPRASRSKLNSIVMRDSNALTAAAFVIALLTPSVRGWTISGGHAGIIASTRSSQSLRHNLQTNIRCDTRHCRRATSGSGADRHVPTCKLERLPRRTLRRIVPLRPTTDKWLAHFGQTATERRRKVVDGVVVAFMIYWTAFFASRTLMGPLAWRASCFAVLVQAFLRPAVESYNRALELWGEGDRVARSKTKGALFTGRYVWLVRFLPNINLRQPHVFSHKPLFSYGVFLTRWTMQAFFSMQGARKRAILVSATNLVSPASCSSVEPRGIVCSAAVSWYQ